MRTLALALLTVPGCAGVDETEEPACAETSATIELGTGHYAFEPLVDGDRVVLVNGPQGGWHVWTAGRVTATGPALSVHASLVGSASGSPLAGSDDEPWSLDLTTAGVGDWDEPTCSGEFYGQFALVDDAVPSGGASYLDLICGLEGRELTFTVTLTDPGSAEETSDTRQVVAELDPANVTYCHR